MPLRQEKLPAPEPADALNAALASATTSPEALASAYAGAVHELSGSDHAAAQALRFELVAAHQGFNTGRFIAALRQMPYAEQFSILDHLERFGGGEQPPGSIVLEALKSDKFLCSRRDAADERERSGKTDRRGYAPDKWRRRVFTAENEWWGASGCKRLFANQKDMSGFSEWVLSDELLSIRYPFVDDLYEQLEVSINTRLSRTAGQMFLGETRIELSPRHAAPEVLLHEMAHILMDNDPRYEDMSPRPQHHGPDFVSAMLDLVEIAYGSEERQRLRHLYLSNGVRADVEDVPLYPNPPGHRPDTDVEGLTIPNPALAAPNTDTDAQEGEVDPLDAPRPLLGLKPIATCRKIVKRTGKPCLLAPRHEGWCRSVLPKRR